MMNDECRMQNEEGAEEMQNDECRMQNEEEEFTAYRIDVGIFPSSFCIHAF